MLSARKFLTHVEYIPKQYAVVFNNTPTEVLESIDSSKKPHFRIIDGAEDQSKKGDPLKHPGKICRINLSESTTHDSLLNIDTCGLRIC